MKRNNIRDASGCIVAYNQCRGYFPGHIFKTTLK